MSFQRKNPSRNSTPEVVPRKASSSKPSFVIDPLKKKGTPSLTYSQVASSANAKIPVIPTPSDSNSSSPLTALSDSHTPRQGGGDSLRHGLNLRTEDIPPMRHVTEERSSHLRQYPSIFEGIPHLKDTPLWAEPLHASVENYHPPFDPDCDNDPLIEFGAINGRLPGRPPEDSIVIRDALWRWTTPHRESIWEDLPSYVEEFETFKVTEDDITALQVGSERAYTLSKPPVQHIGHMVLALSQILLTLGDYVNVNSRMAFDLDPGYRMLRLIAYNTDPLKIRLSIPLLQRRAIIAARKIKTQFNGLRSLFLTHPEAESVKSFNSTRSSERSLFAKDDATVALARLLLRDDYAKTIPRELMEARRQLIDIVGTKIIPRQEGNLCYRLIPHVDRIEPSEETRLARTILNQDKGKERVIENDNHAIEPYYEFDSISRALQASRYPPKPSSVSAVRNWLPMPQSLSSVLDSHPITSMPGVLPRQLNAPDSRQLNAPNLRLLNAPDQRQRNAPDFRQLHAPDFRQLHAPIKESEAISRANRTVHWENYKLVNDSIYSYPMEPSRLRTGNEPREEISHSYNLNNSNARNPPDNKDKNEDNWNQGTPDKGLYPGRGPPGDGPPGGGPPGGGPPGGGSGPPSRGPFERGSPRNDVHNRYRHGGNDPDDPDPGHGGYPDPSPHQGPWTNPPLTPHPADVWQLNKKLTSVIIPSWDGRDSSLIDYVTSMSSLARLSSQMAEGLGNLGPHKWSGKAKLWWDTVPAHQQIYLVQSWEHLLLAIRRQFMDDNWIMERTSEFEEMKFRQKGHENEAPLEFFQRRIRHNLFLWPDPEDGPLVVHRIIRVQPVPWSTLINVTSCPSLFDVQVIARGMAKALMSTYSSAANSSRQTSRIPRASPSYFKKRTVNLAQAGEDQDENDPLIQDWNESDSEESKEANVITNSRRGVPPSKQSRDSTPKDSSSPRWPLGQTVNGVAFPRIDNASNRIPPEGLTCYICTSPKHYALDCTHYGRWQALRKANLIDSHVTDEVIREAEVQYVATLIESMPSVSAYPVASSSKREAYTLSAQYTGASALHAQVPYYQENRNSRRQLAFEKKGKAKAVDAIPLSKYIITSNSKSSSPKTAANGANKRNGRSIPPPAANSASPDDNPYNPESAATSASPINNATDQELAATCASPPIIPSIPYSAANSASPEIEIVAAPKGRQLPEGLGSLGAQALHIKTHVSALSVVPIPGRLDSGADITLISEEYWNSLPNPPKLRNGLRIRLYHLTGGAKVLGYIKTFIYVMTEDGVYVEFELEAYVVRGMRVPLLLGEDFQTTYELNVQRRADGSSFITFGNSKKVIRASSGHGIDIGFNLRQAMTSQSFVRRKATARAKAKARASGGNSMPPEVLAADDVIITAGSVHNVRIEAPFEGRIDWLVEKLVIGSESSDILVAPTTWIDSAKPYLPIANPGTRPWYIRKGDVVGHLMDPSTYLDRPNDTQRLRMAASAEALQSVIQGTLRMQDLGSATGPSHSSLNDRLEGDEDWGPKTAALPDEPSEGLVTDLVNLGPDIPDRIRPRLEAVLLKNSLA